MPQAAHDICSHCLVRLTVSLRGKRPAHKEFCLKVANDKPANVVVYRYEEHLKMMEWSNQKILEFIEDYRAHPVLWCTKLKDYKVKKFRNAAMKDLSTKYECDERALKTKIKSLRSYFHKEHARTLKKKIGSTGEKYVSSWFAYNALLFITENDTPPAECNVDIYTKCESNASETQSKDADKELDGSEDDLSNEPFLDDNADVDDAEVKFSTSMTDTTKSPKRKIEENLAKSEDARETLKSKSPKRVHSPPRDEFSIFGEHVACKLRKLNDGRLQSIAEQQINNILFNIEMANLYQPKNISTTNCLQSTIFSQPPNFS